MIPELPPSDAQGGEKPCEGCCCRSLDIVVETTDFVAVFLQKPEGISVGKIFKLNESSGKNLLYRQYEIPRSVHHMVRRAGEAV